MNPFRRIWFDMKRIAYRRRAIKGIDLRDAWELQAYYDAARWFHRRSDGKLVARRWDTWDEVEIEEDALASFLRELPPMRGEIGKSPGDALLDETTSADPELLHAIKESGRTVVVVREHPLERKGWDMRFWIGPQPPPRPDEYGRPMKP